MLPTDSRGTHQGLWKVTEKSWFAVNFKYMEGSAHALWKPGGSVNPKRIKPWMKWFSGGYFSCFYPTYHRECGTERGCVFCNRMVLSM